jgi:hypothetical protein
MASRTPLQIPRPRTESLTGLIERLAGAPDDSARWAELEAVLTDINKVDMRGLGALKAAVSEMPAMSTFFENVLPCMLRAALDSPRVFPDDTALLFAFRRGSNAHVELDEDQVACLLAHAFLGTLEPLPRPVVRRTSTGAYDRSDPALVTAVDGELVVPHFGDPSWWRILQNRGSVACERMKCFLAYWHLRATASGSAAGTTARRIVRFERVCLGAAAGGGPCPQVPDWASSSAPLASVAISLGRCEDVQGAAALVDFANKDLHIASVIPSCTQVRGAARVLGRTSTPPSSSTTTSTTPTPTTPPHSSSPRRLAGGVRLQCLPRALRRSGLLRDNGGR